MREVDDKRSATWSPDHEGTAAGPGPGKATLTERLPAHQGVQLKADGAASSAAIHESAQQGIATASSPLPHGETIQRLFGRHSISGVEAHTGPEAAASAQAIGAQGYATGNHVVLGERADLHTVAHEAAHVVQQRGGVQLKGGVGETGDAYERQANAVADRVVRGESAEDVLGAPGSDGAGGARAVQLQDTPAPAGPVQIPSGPAPVASHVTASTHIIDGPYAWQSKFEVTQSGNEYRVVIKPKLVPDAGVTPAQVLDVKQRAHTAFVALFDNKFILTDTASHTAYNLRADVQFVDSDEHYTVALHTGPDGTGNLTNWYTGSFNETLAHELGHQLGLKDEYIDATAPDRATAASPGVHTDHSIMGNYLSEGRPAAGAQLRHGETIGNEIGGATGHSFTVSRRP